MEDEKRSKQIGSVLGPTLLMVNISEIINLGIWAENLPPVTYLNGLLLFAAGLAIVRFHNRWRPRWTVCITIVGWLMMAGGLFRLYFPTVEQADATPVTYAFVGFLGLLGLIITVKAYVR